MVYVVGIVCLLLVLQVLAMPLMILLKILGNSVVGGLALWVFNLLGGAVGVHLALNPLSAAVVGLLGVPGLLGLGIIRVLLG